MHFRLFLKSTFLLILLCASGAIHKAMAQNASDTTGFRITNPLDEVSTQYRIAALTVKGEHTYTPDFIKGTSRLRVGDEIKIPGPKIGNAIKSLYGTGLFSDVKIIQTGLNGNNVSLEIVVQEQPRLANYTLKGIKGSERKDLKQKMPILVGFAITQSTETQAVQTIKQFFADKGYEGTKVHIKRAGMDTAANRVSLEFDISKGKRLEIKKIKITGNKAYSAKKVRKELKGIHQDAWWRFFSKAVFKRNKFNDAKKHLRDFYHNHGYRDFRILHDTVFVYDYKPGHKGLQVDLDIYEGPQYHIRNIKWDGNTVYTDAQLTAALDMHKGDVFDAKKLDENLHINKSNSDVTSMYQDIGYLFFQVNPEITDVAGDSVDMTFHIIEDQVATINMVEINGNTRTHDNVIRRNLRTVPGDRYSRQRVIRSVRELTQLNYFEQKGGVSPNLDPNYQDKTVNIIYNLKEATGNDNFEFSGGFGGQGVGLILSAKLNFNNFSIQNIGNKKAWNPLPSGDGQKVSLGVQVTGGGYQNYEFGFSEPWFNGHPTSLGFNVSYSLFKNSGFFAPSTQHDELFSTSIFSTRQLKWPDDYFTQTTALVYQHFNVNGSFYNDQGKLSTITLRESIERNSLDNPINPTEGSKLTLTGELAPPIFGLSQYYKVIFKYQHHIPIVGKLVMTNSAEFGHMGWIGHLHRSPYERFYLGGTALQQQQTFTRDNIDLKGYPGGFNGSISPIVNGNPVGGTMYDKFYTELRYPVVSTQSVMLIPYLFAEGGNAFLGFKNFNPFSIKRSAGFGMRVYLPILGLIDLSYGYRFDGIPNTQVTPGKWEFLFNIGSPF